MLDIKQIESFYPENLRPFKRNLLREYVQYKILETVYESDWSQKLVFTGGTAIHLLHGNTRFFDLSRCDFTEKKWLQGRKPRNFPDGLPVLSQIFGPVRPEKRKKSPALSRVYKDSEVLERDSHS